MFLHRVTKANPTVLYVEKGESDRLLPRTVSARESVETALRMVSDVKLALEYLSEIRGFSLNLRLAMRK